MRWGGEGGITSAQSVSEMTRDNSVTDNCFTISLDWQACVRIGMCGID